MIESGGAYMEGLTIRIVWVAVAVLGKDVGCECVVYAPICCFLFDKMPYYVMRWFVSV